MTDIQIPGGYILLSRKLLKSGIMEKPPLYLKLFVWMLLNASHTDHGNLKRGQLFTSLERMREVMKYRTGASLRRPTKRKIRRAAEWLSKVHAIVTMKVTHGLIITILNYDYYQCPENYEGHTEGHSDGHREGTILTRMDNKNDITPEKFSEKILKLRERYPDQNLLDRVFSAIASTRKSNRVSESILYSQLERWERFPVSQVETGIRTYLNKGYADQGKREAYLYAIIQNGKPAQRTPKAQPANLFKADWY